MSATETEAILVDAAIRNWTASVDRATRFFGGLSEQQLLLRVAPTRNRLIYLWGHLTAVHDALLPLLGLGVRLHPELDAIFIAQPDGAVSDLPASDDLSGAWKTVNEDLASAFSRLTPAEWVQKHTNVSDEDFEREPHRNRFAILLGRTSHLSYHLGQAVLAVRK